MNWQEVDFNPRHYNIGREVEVRWVVENLRGGGRLLDVGCQDSRFGDMMVPFYDEVWGIDIRPLNDRCQDVPKSYKFVVGSIITYPFDADYFDEITFISTLEHIGVAAYTNKEICMEADFLALMCCYRIIKPNGRILVTIPHSEEVSGRYHNGELWERIYSVNDFTEIVKASGLKIEKLDVVGRNIQSVLTR